MTRRGAAGKQAGRRRTRASRGRHLGAPGSWPLPAGLVAGAVLDVLAGDPRRAHPVAAFGRAAAMLESRLYADGRLRGAAYACACVAAATLPAAAVSRLTRRHPLARGAAAAITAWVVTGARSLRGTAERVAILLEAGDIEAARDALPALCGRDPDGLGAKELARAVTESVAENTSDAAVAPLLWGAAAGLPGLAAYRAVNTLDAMVGYRSPRYARFGWASARFDDAANWVPARLTALLTAACAPAAGGSPAGALRAAYRYGARHPSPNAGYPEAAFAGALGLRLGGSSSYGGVAEHRPELGEGRPPGPADIRRAIRLSRAVTAAATVLAAFVAVLVRAGVPGSVRASPASRGSRSGLMTRWAGPGYVSESFTWSPAAARTLSGRPGPVASAESCAREVR
ncbi:MAG TPA: cobalamin biosynthesis protein [Streptosporangiaceae bacterium]|nr:cobalamin biosynthesis protein [Streptosporangiaceae bacterium]